MKVSLGSAMGCSAGAAVLSAADSSLLWAHTEIARKSRASETDCDSNFLQVVGFLFM